MIERIVAQLILLAILIGMLYLMDKVEKSTFEKIILYVLILIILSILLIGIMITLGLL